MATYIESVAGEVRAEAARRRQTVSEIAVVLGMHRTTVADRWNGRRPWQLDELRRLAESWGVPLEQFTQPRAAA